MEGLGLRVLLVLLVWMGLLGLPRERIRLVVAVFKRSEGVLGSVRSA